MFTTISTATTRWTTSGLGFGFEKENIFFQKHFFVSGENKQDNNTFNEVFSCGIINRVPSAPGGKNRLFGRTKKIMSKKTHTSGRLNKNPGRPGLFGPGRPKPALGPLWCTSTCRGHRPTPVSIVEGTTGRCTAPHGIVPPLRRPADETLLGGPIVRSATDPHS